MEAGIRPRFHDPKFFSTKKGLSKSLTEFQKAEDPFARREVKVQKPEEKVIEEQHYEIKEEEEEGDHAWNFRYNRRLACFSHPVASLCFAEDGRWFLSSQSTGDIKVWDTGLWAENTKIKSSAKGPPRSIVVSPGQKWMVISYATELQVFHCRPPWRMEQAIPAPLDPATAEPSEWCCLAFSPVLEEVDDPKGSTGSDYYLAAFSRNQLVVMDYSAGWCPEFLKGRTRSLLQMARPNALVYTTDGFYLVVGFESGQIQIWNAFSLTLERTLNAHTGQINGIASSPRHTRYDPRFVSCSADQSLRIWHARGWVLEQVVPDMKSDINGVKMCTFSSSGHWLISVGTDVCVWQVVHTNKGRLFIRIHQRLQAACGAEGISRAAISPTSDAIAVGGRDGILGLYMKNPGAPLESYPDQVVSTSPTNSKTRPVFLQPMDKLPRPMRKIKPSDTLHDKLASKVEWFQQQRLLTRHTSATGWTGNRQLAGGVRMSKTMSSIALTSALARDTAEAGSHSHTGSPTGASPKSLSSEPFKTRTMPDFARSLPASAWRGGNGNLEYGDMMGWSTMAFSDGKGKRYVSGTPSGEDLEAAERLTPMKKSILHACRGKLLVQRISLDPKSITEHDRSDD